MTTLAPAFMQALPVLGTVPTTYSHEFRAELLYDLCTALVREGLGGPETWWKCEGSAQVFAQRAIMESIGEARWNPRAVSNKGALGLMQLMPTTARRFGAYRER